MKIETNKVGKDHTHAWVCRTLTGMVNEIKTDRELTQKEVLGLTGKTLEYGQVCPHGTIICRICNAPFDPEFAARPAVDIRVFLRNIKLEGDN